MHYRCSVASNYKRSLSNSDVEQDLRDVRRGLKNCETIVESKTKKTDDDDDESTKKQSSIDVRIEDGRLWYQRAWFSKKFANTFSF